jgi:hypothetical protein
LSNYIPNFAELGTSEESGKDWSDLEAEAAAADKEDFNVSSLGLLLSTWIWFNIFYRMTSAETRRASSPLPPAASTRAAVAAANTTAVAASTAAAAANTRALKKVDTAEVRPEATALPPRKATRINTAGTFYLDFFF